jgi:GNAT superfamily N-acetyltransferase
MFRRPAPLSETHQLSEFDCGKSELNTFLTERAMANHVEGYSRTYVIADEEYRVVGYYSICTATIGRSFMPRKIGSHGAPAEVPVILLARLAVDRRCQGLRLGADLLQHSLETAVLSADRIGVRAVLVHAIDDEAVAFYKKYNFHLAKNLDRTLLRSLTDIAKSLEAARFPT